MKKIDNQIKVSILAARNQIDNYKIYYKVIKFKSLISHHLINRISDFNLLKSNLYGSGYLIQHYSGRLG